MGALLSDVMIATICNALYAYPGYAPVVWDHLEQPESDDGICWAIKRIAGVDLVVLRGSRTQQDWLRDFDALAWPFDPKVPGFASRFFGFDLTVKASDRDFLGPVHPGFLAGMDDAWAAMKPLLGPRVIVTGHSLGAARAAILTGIMVHDGKPPLECITFGQPRPGFPQLGKFIAGVPQTSYCNGNGSVIIDMVTEVPLAIGPEDYCHPHPLTAVHEEPSVPWFERYGVFAYHGMPLYLVALEKLAGVPPSAPAGASIVDRAHAEIH
jgi:hypothetical protein